MSPPDPVHPAQDALDRRFMRDALALGRRGLGRTAPNPAVGAVVVREGPGGPLIVGRGFTQPGGRPHAEAVALEAAGIAAVGAILYVTLEPCAHRTQRGTVPCVERAMLTGLRRVVSAMDDPNPRMAGLSHALMRSAGIQVRTGVLGAEAARDHRGHVLRVTGGRPMVTLKLAQTGDGFAAGPGGRRIAITGEATNRRMHLLRAHHDAILVGIGTVLADDPRLDVRLPGLAARSPIRIVLDSHLRLPTASFLARSAADRPLILVATESAPVEAEHRLVAAGASVLRVGRTPDGALDLAEALRLLADQGITRILAEGGPRVAEALVLADLADDVILLHSLAPLGEPGIPAVRAGLAAALAEPGRYRLAPPETVGADTLSRYERTG